MAKIITNPTAGKIGLQVFYPGRNGQVVRQWVVPANPKTGDQLLVRSHLTQVTRAWGSLTELQRQAWISAALNYNTNPVLGQSGKLTGAQLHTKINCALLAIGAAVVTLPPAAPSFAGTGCTALEITNTAGTIAIKLATSSTPPDGTMLRGSAPQSAGTYRAISLRLLGTLESPVGGKVDITAQYTAKFGAPVAGQKLFVSVTETFNGWEGTPVLFSGVVPAAA